MQRIRSIADIETGLDALAGLDPRLAAVRAVAGEVPLRLIEPGFESLANVIVSQQVSRASAEAIFGRLARLLHPLSAQTVLAAGAEGEVFRTAGLSRSKQRALLAVAAAVTGGLDLHHLCRLEAPQAVAHLTAIPGIGRWTAECYLLFAAGHPDIFPVGDVALQAAVGRALGIEPRPGEKALAGLAESWSPWRGVAARLFWAYYREWKSRDAVPAV